MEIALQVAAGIWGVWVALNLLMVALVATVLPVHQVHFDGFRARLPASLPALLEPAEITAVVAHERGHGHHWHIWINLLLRCLLLAPGPQLRRRQELEADDYAVARGHGANLASALRKLSSHPDDVSRAERLERM
ncbi:hypothetical protein FHI69_02960 [Janthinobacterium lividum]|uniref:Uncharacterized protein n=1 Tax=Janthinobacterium lividum TaxID=29581 RepID=A0A5C4NW32_9BURK|nr:hypothetical protein [Janthinobacterium lividum]TNC78272.1 hypothetical protein FHI69_02960 [Janthinobacterium lividum]